MITPSFVNSANENAYTSSLVWIRFHYNSVCINYSLIDYPGNTSLSAHSFPMHSFSTPLKHKKTNIFDVFRR